MSNQIPMVDLKGQYEKIKKSVEDAIFNTLNSTHVFHQYTLKTKPELRDKVINYLKERGIPAMIYYPLPLYKQEAFSHYVDVEFKISNIETLCKSVFSLPMHTEIESSSQDYIIQKVRNFFNKN